jgi:hypothetical protein
MGRNPPVTYLTAVEDARGIETQFQLTKLQQRRTLPRQATTGQCHSFLLHMFRFSYLLLPLRQLSPHCMRQEVPILLSLLESTPCLLLHHWVAQM